MATETKVKKKKAKWTPGPWEIIGATQVVKFGEDWACIAEACIPRSESDKQVHSRAHVMEPARAGSPRFHEAAANAKLISKAPELYEMLLAVSEGHAEIGEIRALLKQVIS